MRNFKENLDLNLDLEIEIMSYLVKSTEKVVGQVCFIFLVEDIKSFRQLVGKNRFYFIF